MRYRRHHPPPTKQRKADEIDLVVKVDNNSGLVLEAIRSGGMSDVQMRECFGGLHAKYSPKVLRENGKRAGTLVPLSHFSKLTHGKRMGESGMLCNECREYSSRKAADRKSRQSTGVAIMKQAPPFAVPPVLDAEQQARVNLTVERMVMEKNGSAPKLPQWRVTILKQVTIFQEETRTVEAKDFLDAGAVASEDGEVIKVERITS